MVELTVVYGRHSERSLNNGFFQATFLGGTILCAMVNAERKLVEMVSDFGSEN